MSKVRGIAAGLTAVLALAAAPSLGAASRTLLYFEIQGIGGYSTGAGKAIFYSTAAMESMQKPSLGFDFVQRLSGRSGDFAVISVQARLAWNAEGDKALEPQIYNAYIKFKTKLADVWLGHATPRFGLSAVLDSHAALLQPLAMSGFGFDRDWGIGLERDTVGGNWGVSLTTGSGMTTEFNGGYFLAGRYGTGVLSEDNAAGGFSVGVGQIVDAAGTTVFSGRLIDFYMAAADITWLHNNVEHRIEVAGGQRDRQGAFAALYRIGYNILPENRLKIEVQPAAVLLNGETKLEISAGASYMPHPDWTLRAAAVYDSLAKDARFVLQVYFYKGLNL